MALKNIFISHIHEDDALVSRLIKLLERQGVEVRNGSIDSSKPNDAHNEEYIKREILAPRIDWASVLVVIVNHGTADSDWVNWEIEEAAKQGKQVFGVYAQGATDADVPEALEALGDALLVGWHGPAVADAILQGQPEWETPAGTEREPSWDLQRYRC